jgi:15-cis-phytoene synthase
MDPFAHCEMLVRTGDKERYLSALFAPPQHRGALFALYAFNLEIARIRELVRNPMAGEIRLEWWREILRGENRGGVEGNPVAAALRATIRKHGLSVERLTAILDARAFDLGTEPMRTMRELVSYVEATSSNLIGLAGAVLDRTFASSDKAELVHHAGIAVGMTGLLRAFPVHACRGQLYLPLEVLERHGSGAEDIARGQASAQLREALADLREIARGHLRSARQLWSGAPPAVLSAFLPVALAGPTLAQMERRRYEPFVRNDLAPWRKQWLIWRAARSPARLFNER